MESLRKIGLAVGQTPTQTTVTPFQELPQQQVTSPTPSSSRGIVKKLLTVFSFLTMMATIIGGIFAVLKKAAGALLGQLLGKLNIGSLLSGLAPKGGTFKDGKKNNLKKSSYTPKGRGRGGIGNMAGYGGKRKKKGIRKLFTLV